MKRILFLICTSIVILNCQPGLAKSGLFFSVSSGAANELIINTTIPNHTYPTAGIKLNTPGFTLTGAGTECTMYNGFCLFSVSDTTAKTISVSGNGKFNATLCLNGAGPLSCQKYNNLSVSQIAKYVYITSYANNPPVSVCVVSPTNGQILTCQSAGGGSVIAGVTLEGIVINNAGTTAFLTGYTDTPYVYQCAINSSDGTFMSCSATQITSPSGYDPEYGMLALNPSNTIAYLVDAASRILACPIVDNVISGVCSDTGATNVNDGYASQLALNKAGTTAYLANYSGSPSAFVDVCSVSGTVFSSCIKKNGGSSITFTETGGVALNNAETILYVTDYSAGKVYGCSTSPNNTDLFSSCFVAASGLSQAWGIALNSTNTTAYITNFGNNTYICPILGDGTFGTCTTDSSFSEVVGVTLGY